MATQTTEQQNALKDAMERAKQIAAKLQQQHPAAAAAAEIKHEQDESRKRGFQDVGPFNSEPYAKRLTVEGAVDHTDPKIIAQQVANSLVQRAGLGSMLVEEITIPNKLVGLVIGRGGEMINKLQSDSGAKIQVAPDPPPNIADMIEDREITITGTSDAVNKAKAIIEQIKMEGKVPERIIMNANIPGEYSIEMNIATGKVGLVIGKGGETIKSLQERADCKMVLFQDGEYQNAPEKPLRISGEQSKVMYGKQLVQDLLTMKELESISPEGQHQDGASYDEVQVPREAVGFVIGAKGASINNIQQSTGCRVQFKNDMEGEFKIATLQGSPQQVAMAKQKLNEILQSHRERRGGPGGGGPRNWGGPRGPRPAWGGPQGGGGFNNGPRPGWGGPGGPRGWGPGPRGPSNFGGPGGRGHNLPPGHKHMEIHVPANKCGLVIGKGGETLKHIHNETNVNIEINREIPEVSPFRVFHLRGTDDQIKQAQEIIREKIGDPSVTAKPAGSEGGEIGGHGGGQNQWGPQQGQPWGQQNHQQWGGQQQGWGQQPPPQHDQWGQQGGWNQHQPQQPGGWNQQPGSDAPWNQQQQPQQWQQPGASQNQWQNQQQYPWGQPQQQSVQQPMNPQNPPAIASNVAPAGQTDGSATTDPSAQTAAQTDYSAAWALYYQQQNQYYQQYAMQQQQAPTSTAAPVPGANSAQTPGTPTATSQAAAMADYQAKMAEYYKSFGPQPPMQ